MGAAEGVEIAVGRVVEGGLLALRHVFQVVALVCPLIVHQVGGAVKKVEITVAAGDECSAILRIAIVAIFMGAAEVVDIAVGRVVERELLLGLGEWKLVGGG